VHHIYEKRTASIQKSKVFLIIRCTLWPVKYGIAIFIFNNKCECTALGVQ